MKKKENKLPALAELTETQHKFISAIAQGMLRKDAWRLASNKPDADDKYASVKAAEMAKRPAVAVTLHEMLRERRVSDLDSPGKLVADTLQDQENARQRGSDAAVAAFARMRGNWQGLERQSIVFAAESLLSDKELIDRLAGDDPARIAAAQTLLGAPDSFPEPQDVDYEEVIDDLEAGLSGEIDNDANGLD